MRKANIGGSAETLGHPQLAKEKQSSVRNSICWGTLGSLALGPSRWSSHCTRSNPRAGCRDLWRQKIGRRGRGLWPLGRPFNFRIDLGGSCGLKRRLCFRRSMWFQLCLGSGLCSCLGSGSNWRRSPKPSHHWVRKCAGPGRVLTAAAATTTVLTAS